MEFVYLSVVLDAFSRRAVGWALDRHLEDNLAITALEMVATGRETSVSESVAFLWKRRNNVS